MGVLTAVLAGACGAAALSASAGRRSAPPVLDAEVVAEVPRAQAAQRAAPPGVAAAKARLLRAIAPTRRGFKREGREEVVAAIEQIAGLGVRDAGIQGNWTLAWTDAPDILGLDSPAPLARLGRVGQEITADSIVNVIEWVPNDLARTFLGADGNDSVEQRVILAYTKTGDAVDCRLKGVGLRPRQVLAKKVRKRPLDLVGPADLPFGAFDVLFNDGDLRVVKTRQGYFAVNVKRTAPFLDRGPSDSDGDEATSLYDEAGASPFDVKNVAR